MLMTFNPAINGWAIIREGGLTTACRVMAKRLRAVCTCRKANRSGKPDAASSSAICRSAPVPGRSNVVRQTVIGLPGAGSR